AFHWHGDTFDLPEGALPAAKSAACAHQAFLCVENVVGLQFHLETTVTGARELVEHCAADITEGPYVQPAGVMLAAPAATVPAEPR
ncbi:MAG: hypothetical protein HY705_07995, partial [Gemmatimonadetes bacterium]|nr:hypothetical protein [Gemmatimonadota bacterium]